MKLVRFFKGHGLAWLICIALLVVQANLELALPNYMSNIVDVGLQQGGIAGPVPRTIRDGSLSDLFMFMDEHDMDLVDAAYGPANADGVRAYQGTEAEAADNGAVAKAMVLPECAVLALEQGIPLDKAADGGAAGLSAAMGATSGAIPAGAKLDLETVRQLYDKGIVDRAELVKGTEKMADSMGSMGGSMAVQRAVEYVRQEYQGQGMDLEKVRGDYLAKTALIMFALCAGTLVTTIVDGLVASRTASKIAMETRSKLFAKVMTLSPAEVNRFSQASLITRCTNDVQQVQMVSVMSMRMVMLAPIMGIVAFIQVTASHTGLEWIIGVAVIAISAVMGVLFGLTMPKFQKMQTLVDRVNLVAREMLDGIMPIRAFGREPHERARFAEANGDLMGTQLFTNRAMSFAMPAIMLVMNLVTVSIVWFGADGVAAGSMQVGTMMAFISYTMQIVMSFMVLAMIAIMLPRAQVSAGRIWDVIDCEVSIKDPENPVSPKPGVTGELEFDDVSFTYPDATEPVVEGVSFKTAPGRRVAIIGSTGSGKTTLVKLVPRLYDVSAGAVRLDGVDVRDMALSDLRRRVGYVPQQGLLFSGTIEDNLKFAGDVSDAAMEKAATVAQATDFIEEKEDGFQSAVAQKGSNVSGGQRQRLSIARALAKDPEVLVFDDSFSALDYATDARLREALKREYPKCAVVVVAQRVATIMDADEIVVLDQGHVVGQGTHEALLRTCPTYLEIAESQLSNEELGLTQDEVDALLGRDARKLDEEQGAEIASLEEGLEGGGR